jgi:hypothetical protein
MPGTGCAAVRVRAEDLVDVHDLDPLAMACLIVGMSCGPKIGWTMIPSYCPEVIAVWSSRELPLGVVRRVEDRHRRALRFRHGLRG